MNLLYDLIKGFGIGLLVSIPLGPIGVIIIQRTLNKGWLSGLFSGMGAAFADFFYAILAATGFGIILDLVESHDKILKFIAFFIVSIIGIALFKKNIKTLRKEYKKSPNFFTDFLSVFFLTISNPLAVGVFLALFASTSGQETTIYSIIFILLGVLLGAIFWWLLLTLVINFFRNRIRLRNLYWINKITGLVIFGIGIIGLFLMIFTNWIN